MNWEALTAPEFARAVKKSGGVCIVPVGVVEKHGDHLPLGTDFLFVKHLAELSAAREPAVVFPPYYFGSICEARHQPGAISVRAELFIRLLENVCDEISRNGFTKIVLLDGHGGNRFLTHFVRTMLERERPYSVYLIRVEDWSAGDDSGWKKMKETSVDGHGGECETSCMLEAFPELVKMKSISKKPGFPARRLESLPYSASGISWYAEFPDHYAGDARAATKKKGEYLVDLAVRRVTGLLRAIKRDKHGPRLLREFYARSRRPVK